MSNFDPKFEITRLNMLAKQHFEIVKVDGQLFFHADENEDHFSHGTWTLDEDIEVQASDSGFKLHLIELLNIFIMYRGENNNLPKKMGIVRFGDGELNIQWLTDETVDLS
ncbi:hypothetical protein E8Q33_12240 [Methylophaga sp. SB9B]|uniref:hypothetical protein n=1 Tax=Methylophaga sp. SB9B TaxID=2570356 RepID=UPI0010A86506|nr:hypothetical protein [Methylophaga sp. SB9B]THK40629.1 hypothetical protein E8Q33_12240 [Methylophaga sp. SB9B]